MKGIQKKIREAGLKLKDDSKQIETQIKACYNDVKELLKTDIEKTVRMGIELVKGKLSKEFIKLNESIKIMKDKYSIIQREYTFISDKHLKL